MLISALREPLLEWWLISSFIFLLITLVLFRGKYSKQVEQITSEEPPERVLRQGAASMLLMPLIIIILQILFAYFGILKQYPQATFGQLFGVEYFYFFLIFFFDTFVIDFLILLTWQPAFLRLPKTINTERFKKQLILGLPLGLLFGALITLISSWLVRLFLQ